MKRISLRKTLEILDCSRSHLYHLINKGKIKPKYLGRKPYFSIQEIEEAMSEQSEKLT